MIIGPLTYKALRYEAREKLFVSPSYPDRWNQYGILDATCHACREIPGEDCSCGIYATTQVALARDGYARQDDGVVFLMEATGKVLLYTQGVRAEQGVIIAVVDTHGLAEDTPFSRRNMTMKFAADYFQVPIYPLDLAQEMLEIQWAKYTKGDAHV